MTDAAPRFDSPPSACNHFACLPTRLALERTLMAWVRTCTAPHSQGADTLSMHKGIESAMAKLSSPGGSSN